MHAMKQTIKKAVLRVGRPVWKRLSPKFYARIDRRIDLRFAQLDAGWKQHVPPFLNAVSTVQAFGREFAHSKEEMARLWTAIADVQANVATTFDRVEFVRREIMFEMKYRGTGTGSATEHSRPSTRILNPEKLAAAQEAGAKVNLGCGHIPLAGYVNVDMRELPGVDVVADVGELPFEEASLREVFSAHLLEHFPQEELIRRLLPHWHDLLAPGAAFRAVAPDGEAMLANFAAGRYAFEDFREVLFGAQDYEGDFHYNLLTPTSLGKILEDAGFRDVQVLARGRRNGKCFEFEVAAVK